MRTLRILCGENKGARPSRSALSVQGGDLPLHAAMGASRHALQLQRATRTAQPARTTLEACCTIGRAVCAWLCMKFGRSALLAHATTQHGRGPTNRLLRNRFLVLSCAAVPVRREMEGNRREQCRGWVGFSAQMAHRITAGADLLLMPSRFEPCGLNQLYAMAYGTVPVVHAVGGLRDTVVRTLGTLTGRGTQGLPSTVM